MADAPAPDFDVDETLAARLVASQHPDLAGPLELVANGWDNAVFRLGDDLAVRLPRRLIAVPLIAHEQRWLPGLAPRLPIAVPAPVRIGRPAPELGFAAPWSIVPWFHGVTAAETPPTMRSGFAAALAGFVDALAVPAPVGAPRNPYRGVPLADRDEVVRARLDRLAARTAESDRTDLDVAALREIWRDALAAPVWDGPPLWVHGDLHAGNLVVEAAGSGRGAAGSVAGPDGAGSGGGADAAGGRLVAVVDFGDLTAGDPATDLATAWLTFDADGRSTFRREVERRRSVDEATWRRARGWALVWGGAVVDELEASFDDDADGSTRDDSGGAGPIARLGRFALEQVLAG